jgi:hypothetical protein
VGSWNTSERKELSPSGSLTSATSKNLNCHLGDVSLAMVECASKRGPTGVTAILLPAHRYDLCRAGRSSLDDAGAAHGANTDARMSASETVLCACCGLDSDISRDLSLFTCVCAVSPSSSLLPPPATTFSHPRTTSNRAICHLPYLHPTTSLVYDRNKACARSPRTLSRTVPATRSSARQPSYFDISRRRSIAIDTYAHLRIVA